MIASTRRRLETVRPLEPTVLPAAAMPVTKLASHDLKRASVAWHAVARPVVDGFQHRDQTPPPMPLYEIERSGGPLLESSVPDVANTWSPALALASAQKGRPVVATIAHTRS